MLLALWHAATDREMGSKMSETFYGSGVFLFFVCALVLVALLSLATYVLPGWSGERMANTAVLTGALIGIAYFGTLLCAWPFRQRWAGSLVLSLRSTEQRTIALAAVAANCPTIMGDMVREWHKRGTTHGLGLQANIAWLILIVVLKIG
jgi:hypothetical protein